MIRLEDVSIKQGDFELSGIRLSLPKQAYGILMGPTGAGKTTLVEAICGLRPIQHGEIFLGDQNVTACSPADRQIGYVPQDAVMFPSMKVEQQIGFGLEVRHVATVLRKRRVDELAELLGIGDLLKRFPRGLSGGEKQRVALARALAIQPKLLCLDEPLGALDVQSRTRMIDYLKAVHQQEKATVLHITHHLGEADQLGTVHFQLENGIVTSDE
ncbi:MAG: ATP-binding cassette domain-containing protein [Planctomycetota bacterium]